MPPGTVCGVPPLVSKRSCFGDVPLGGCGKLEQVMKHSDVLVKGDKIVDAVTWVRKLTFWTDTVFARYFYSLIVIISHYE